jgi:TPR repeat protein
LEFLNNKEERKAFECYLENSKNGDAMANYMVGELFLNGTGVEIDYKNATKHYIESNEPLALYRLGQINYYGWGDEINYPASFEWFTKASERGLVEANYYLGSMYYNGNGVEKNIELAIERLEKIANSGVESEMMEKSRHLEYLSFSQGLLGQIYSEPENFDDKDKDEIHRKSGYWYFESARNGNERSKAFTIFGGRFFPIDGGDSCANEHVHFKNLELLDFSESITKKYLNQGNELRNQMKVIQKQNIGWPSDTTMD